MSTSGPRYHIPFPQTFLSLNTRPSQPVSPQAVPASPSPHAFLSNHPAAHRHFSISSVSSNESVDSESVAGESVSGSEGVGEGVRKEVRREQAFLTLNTKFEGKNAVGKKEDRVQSPFLSNRV